ncbi:MAG: magnesium/cobalt transporter CorA [Pseudohongiella sp.]|uniref:magnesium/cobalt transporter CorA n=1 Tax=Pseudohongiella sp. TaxID=1979412 RepID=UPI0034A08ECA
MSKHHGTPKVSRPRQLNRLIRKRGKKVGAAPGTLIHIGPVTADLPRISQIHYNQTAIDESTLTNATDCQPPAPDTTVAWFNVDGLSNPDLVRILGETFKLHPLVMEDILNTDHRPKIEVHDNYLYIVIKMLQFREDSTSITIEQVSLIVGDNYVLSFQERQGDVFNSVRERLRSGRRIRQMGADYLAYALIDAVVDNYFLILENLGDAIEDLEQELIDKPTPTTLHRIHHFKREMLLLRKAVWPLREVLSSLSRDEDVVINSEIRLFLRDVYDHSIHIMDNIDTLRDLLTGMIDLYVSSVSQRMNEIMKVLTIFASIFMPLTFIAGVYGMNFEYMPELAIPWAYPLTLLFMLAVGVGLVLYFKWRKWL